MRYNVGMEKITTAIVGGGASGLMLASCLSQNQKVTVFERGERVGKKLSATGNGQGNVTNLGVLEGGYFSFSKAGVKTAQRLIENYDHLSLMTWLEELGLLLTIDERGRVYPAGRQASSITDALRFYVAQKGVEIRLCSKVIDICKTQAGFVLTATDNEGKEEKVLAKNVVLCAGGKVAKQFGTDGSQYALATSFGHTLTRLYPSLVQLKTDTTYTKTLKGIRVPDARVGAVWQEKGKTQSKSLQGDIMFTEYGVSGDSVFRLSAFIADKLDTGVTLTVDFLPEYIKEEIYAALLKKRELYPALAVGELLCGFTNNQIARAIMKCANNDLQRAAELVKAFELAVKGSMGENNAQVTKGGVCMDEVDENLQSKLVQGLYFAGEILDVDGECGGYNLQWAYSSARAVAQALNEKCGGQV